MRVEDWLGKDNQLGIDIWNKKYRHGNETFDEWIERVSGGNKSIAKLIKEKKFLFGGRILSNRGLAKEGRKITYSNCYVIPAPEDNLESIFDTAKSLARTYSYGGGCGVDLGKLAPAGAKVRNAAETSSGAVSFMDFYSTVTGLISQNGRRGALMLSLPINHPDIEKFIHIKSDLGAVTKANISVRITDDFMEAVGLNKPYKLSFTREATGETIEKEINAKEFFTELCRMNWDYAEPGILYWNTIEQHNFLRGYEEFEYAGTNPCAEEPLPAGGSCLLGSINLAEFVNDKGQFMTDDFRFAVQDAVIALNEVLDEGLPLHPLKVQQDSVRDWRQIGLGIMGLADTLIKLGIKYGDRTAVEFSSRVSAIMMTAAIKMSIDLAAIKGSFPKYNYAKTLDSMIISYLDTKTYRHLKQNGIRNSQLLTCAPTGSISTMLGVSGGIEPIFANYYTRKTESLHGHDEYYKVYTPIVADYMKRNNLTDDSQLPDYFVTAHEIAPKDRILMQAAWQANIDASISSTVNLPNEATVEEVIDLYLDAWHYGLKGLTIFRDGCARVGILTTDKPKEEKKKVVKPAGRVLRRGEIIAVDDDLIGVKKKLMSGCGTLHCEAFFDKYDGSFREIYLSKGSTGGCNNFMIGLSRMISLAARGGIALEDIIDQLMSTGVCPSYRARTVTKHDTSQGSCCPMAVGYALREMQEEILEYIINRPVADEPVSDTDINNDSEKIIAKCPDCGADLEWSNGCVHCPECGYSKCD